MSSSNIFRRFSDSLEWRGRNLLSRRANGDAEVAHLSSFDVVHPSVDEDIGERLLLARACHNSDITR